MQFKSYHPWLKNKRHAQTMSSSWKQSQSWHLSNSLIYWISTHTRQTGIVSAAILVKMSSAYRQSFSQQTGDRTCSYRPRAMPKYLKHTLCLMPRCTTLSTFTRHKSKQNCSSSGWCWLPCPGNTKATSAKQTMTLGDLRYSRWPLKRHVSLWEGQTRPEAGKQS